jgi:hypothetical protein
MTEKNSRTRPLFLHQQGIDTTTPAGKAMFQMMGVFAEFEPSATKRTCGTKTTHGCGFTIRRTESWWTTRSGSSPPSRPSVVAGGGSFVRSCATMAGRRVA